MVHTRLNRLESALFLRDFYCKKYLPQYDSNIETALGSVANRLTYEPVVDTDVQDMLNDYTRLCVYELLGLTFEEYMDTSRLMKIQYRVHLEKVIKERANINGNPGVTSYEK